MSVPILDMDGARTLAATRDHRIERVDGPGGPYIVKRIASPRDRRAATARLENEHLLARLAQNDGPRRVLGTTVLVGSPALVFSDPGGRPLRDVLARSEDDAARLALAIALAEETMRLHAIGLTHGDLCIDNVLVLDDGRALLVDLGLGTFAADTVPEVEHPSELAAHLATMSPERTGRLRRRSDRRADLYSLGATLHELFAGTPPFDDTDPLTLIQSHIAREPPKLLAVASSAPVALARIVRTLLAKRPEDRYQDAAAVTADLRRVLERTLHGRSSADIVPASGTLSPRFAAPTELPGLADDRKEIFAALDRTAAGGSEGRLLTGPRGVGKGALVIAAASRAARLGFEIVRIGARRDGGRSEQPRLMSALAPIVRRLGEGDDPVSSRRLERLRTQLGPCAAVLRTALPEVAHLFAPSPQQPFAVVRTSDAPAATPAVDIERRSELTLLQLVRGLASNDAPLLLIVEDIEGVDGDTLMRIDQFVARAAVPHLMLLATSHDVEGTDRPEQDDHGSRAAMQHEAIDSLRRSAVRPLEAAETGALVADALLAAPGDVAALSARLHARSGGVPLAVLEALEDMRLDGRLHYDQIDGRWRWSIPDEAIDEAIDEVKDDARTASTPTASFARRALERLERLAPDAFESLQTASVFGGDFDVEDLAMLRERTSTDVLRALRAAVDARILEPLPQAGRLSEWHRASETPRLRMHFVHEETMEALFRSLDDSRRARLHGRLGARMTADQDADRIRFREGVLQLDSAAQLDPRAAPAPDILADMNLRAGRAALARAEPRSAYRFLRAGLGMLGPGAFEDHARTAIALTEAAMEAATLCGDPGQAERLGRAALLHLDDEQVRLRLVTLLTRALRLAGRRSDAMQIALDCLAACAQAPSQLPFAPLVARCLWRGRRLLRRPPAIGATGQTQTREVFLAALCMDMALDLCLEGAPESPAILDRMTTLALHHPDPGLQAFTHACLAGLCVRFGLSDDARRHRSAAMDRTGRANSTEGRSTEQASAQDAVRIRLLLQITVAPWLPTELAAEPALLEIQRDALDLGDVETASQAAAHFAQRSVFRGQELVRVGDELDAARHALDLFPHASGLEVLRLYSASLHQLLDPADRPQVRPRPLVDAHHLARAHASTLDAWFALREGNATRAASMLDEPDMQALAERPGVLGARLQFLQGIAQADLARRATTGSARRRALQRARTALGRLRRWIARGLADARHLDALLTAELRACGSDVGRALQHYEHAIRIARDDGQLHDEEMAWARCARYLRSTHRHEVAERFEDGARACAERSRAAERHNGSAHSAAGQATRLLQASRAITRQIDPDALVETLFDHVRSTHMADHVALVLMDDDAIILHAVAEQDSVGPTGGAPGGPSRSPSRADADTVSDTGAHTAASARTSTLIRYPDRPLSECAAELATSVVQFAVASRRLVVLDESATEDVFALDPRIVTQAPGAIACAPMLVGERLVGALYVERTEGFAGAGRDALELLAAQAAVGLDHARLYGALARARDEYRALFDHAVEGIFQLDIDGKLLIANASLAQTLGYRDPEQLLGEVPVLPRDVAMNVESVDGIIDAIVEHGAVSAFEFEAFRRDGTRIWLELSARTIVDEEGEITRIEGSLVDATERRQRQYAEQAREAAEGATLAKTRFLASMSHEIRTPMNAILGFSDLTLQTALDDRQRGWVSTIHDAAGSLLGIIDDILDLSRIEAGRMELVDTGIDLCALLLQMETLFGTRARERRLAFEIVGIQALRDAIPEDQELLGDGGRVRQVVINLLDNALKFTTTGGVVLRVRVLDRNVDRYVDHDVDHNVDQNVDHDAEAGVDAGADADADPGTGARTDELHIRFEVEDTGPGIDEADLERLFGAFEQLEAGSTRVHAGAGLGLAISRQLVTLMGGTLGVSSTPGRGSCFHFDLRLPLAPADPAATAAPRRPSRTALRGRRLLLAEDNRINQQLALEYLEWAGARVEVTETGTGVLEAVGRRRFDAIVMDLHMPGMDGIETCRALRRSDHAREVPVVAVTADAVGDARVRAREAGFDAFILKPVDRDTLVDSLAALLPDVVWAPGPPAEDAPTAADDYPTPSLPGLDVRRGLRNHNDNAALYQRLLGDFQGYYGDAAREVRELLARDRIEEAARIVHNVHGVAGSFGAERLRTASADLERAIEEAPGHVDRRLTIWEQALAEALRSSSRIANGDVSLGG